MSIANIEVTIVYLVIHDHRRNPKVITVCAVDYTCNCEQNKKPKCSSRLL